jgi:hypothetical protein
MSESGDTLSVIFKAQTRSSEGDRLFWLWLGSAYSILLSRAPDISAYSSNIERSYGAAKQIVMELWTIRAFFTKLKIQTARFDEVVPNLKAFRDAIAHIDERAEGMMLLRGGVKTPVAPGKTSLAGGYLTTIDGHHWNGLNYCYGLIGSRDGLYTAFGMVRDWIITNTDLGAVELQLNDDFFENLDDLIRIVAENYSKAA